MIDPIRYEKQNAILSGELSSGKFIFTAIPSENRININCTASFNPYHNRLGQLRLVKWKSSNIVLDNTDKTLRFDKKITPIATLDMIIGKRNFSHFDDVTTLLLKLSDDETNIATICDAIDDPFLLGRATTLKTLWKSKHTKLERVEFTGEDANRYWYEFTCDQKEDPIEIRIEPIFSTTTKPLVTSPMIFEIDKTPKNYMNKEKIISDEQEIIKETKKPYWSKLCNVAKKQWERYNLRG